MTLLATPRGGIGVDPDLTPLEPRLWSGRASGLERAAGSPALERGASIATLTIANSRAGVARLCRWLQEHGADGVAVGVENAGGYGRLLCAVLVAAGHEVLNVPAWRVKRERVHEGPGKSDPADAVAIAQCVLRHRDKLGPALEPPLIRAIALLETHRRQSVTRRTDAIQRLRAVWAQLDPEAECATSNVATKRALRHLKEIDFGDGLAEHAAARCIHDLACEIEALNTRVGELERELAELLAAPGASATSPTSSTGVSTPGPNGLSRHRLDIGASSGLSPAAT